MKKILFTVALAVLFTTLAFGQIDGGREKADPEAIVKKAVEKLGGPAYENATSLSSEGKLSITQDQKIMSFQSFVDIVVFPDKERTDFSEGGTDTIQVNTGDEGWLYEELYSRFGPQTEAQVANFKRSLKTHYDYLLRGHWRGNAELTFVERRPASLGKRNNVLRLEFEDGFWVEYEFGDDGYPAKTVYTTKDARGESVKEENRYAQFIFTDGIYFPFIVDHFVEGKRSYRVNYTEVRFNKRIDDSIFEKPADPKKIKKMKI